MNPTELFHQASDPAGITSTSGSDADPRRAVCALYYALFHTLSADAAAQVASASSPETQALIRRTISHVQIRKACEVFRGSPQRLPKLRQALLQSPLEPEFAFIPSTFIGLQEDQCLADYDAIAQLHKDTIQADFLWQAQLAITGFPFAIRRMPMCSSLSSCSATS